MRQYIIINNTVEKQFVSLSISRTLRIILTLFFSLSLADCATYKPLPLSAPLSLISLNDLIKNIQTSPLIKKRAINIKDGLNSNEIVTLVLFNSPKLQIYKRQYAQTQANAYAQGLLPEPQISLGTDHPTSNTLTTVNAWTSSFGFDLTALLTFQAKQKISEQQTKQAQLNLQWQAWQIAQNAQLLLIDIHFVQQKIHLINSMILILKKRYQQTKKGLTEQNVTLATSGSDLTALLTSYSRLNIMEQTLNDKSYQLDQLLGITGHINLPIALIKPISPITEQNITTQLVKLAQTRPDLLALKYGYLAQEQSVRSSIFAQFPAISIGITTAKDTGGLRTQGLNIGISLPLFNGNKGNILVARATRETLALEYKSRLLNTKNTVEKLWQLHHIINTQQQQLKTYLSTLTSLRKQAKCAYQSGDISSLTYISMASSWFNKKMEQLDLTRAQWRIKTTLSLLLMLPQSHYISVHSLIADNTKNIISKPIH